MPWPAQPPRLLLELLAAVQAESVSSRVVPRVRAIEAAMRRPVVTVAVKAKVVWRALGGLEAQREGTTKVVTEAVARMGGEIAEVVRPRKTLAYRRAKAATVEAEMVAAATVRVQVARAEAVRPEAAKAMKVVSTVTVVVAEGRAAEQGERANMVTADTVVESLLGAAAAQDGKEAADAVHRGAGPEEPRAEVAR